MVTPFDVLVASRVVIRCLSAKRNAHCVDVVITGITITGATPRGRHCGVERREQNPHQGECSYSICRSRIVHMRGCAPFRRPANVDWRS